MEVTKKEASKILGISPAEVVRRVESGDLVGRKKTASKYSDWLVTIPDKKTVAGWQKKEPVPDDKEIEKTVSKQLTPIMQDAIKFAEEHEEPEKPDDNPLGLEPVPEEEIPSEPEIDEQHEAMMADIGIPDKPSQRRIIRRQRTVEKEKEKEQKEDGEKSRRKWWF